MKDVERWLHEKVSPAYDALKADPARAVTADQVRARLSVEHANAQSCGKNNHHLILLTRRAAHDDE